MSFFALVLGTYLAILAVALLPGAIARASAATKRQLPTEHGSDCPDVVVTLVHGTWAQNAEWTGPSSAFCTALAAALGRVKFHCHQWPGRNSLAARRRGADSLRRALKERADRYPGAHHVVIAHSHGGNVALAAIDPDLAGRISGLVCLATPVFVSRKRHYHGATLESVTMLILIPPVVAVLAGAPMPLILLAGAWTLAAILILILWSRLAQRFSEILVQANYDHIPSHKALFVRSAADEASGAIAAANMLTWFTTRVATTPIRYHALGKEQIRRWSLHYPLLQAGWLFAGGLLWTAFWALALTGFLWGGEAFPNKPMAFILTAAPLALYLGYKFGSAIMEMAIAPFLLLPVIIMTVVSGIAIGWDFTLGALVREVTVEPCPPGTWNVVVLPEEQLMPRPDKPEERREWEYNHEFQRHERAARSLLDFAMSFDASSKGPLRLQHSQAYATTVAHSIIVTWLLQRLGKASQEPEARG